jgi:hypothetical protein
LCGWGFSRSPAKSSVSQAVSRLCVLLRSVHQELPENFDILCTHPMFGPESGKHSWEGLTFMYEKVREHGAQRMGNSAMSSEQRMDAFLRVWQDEVCAPRLPTRPLHRPCPIMPCLRDTRMSQITLGKQVGLHHLSPSLRSSTPSPQRCVRRPDRGGVRTQGCNMVEMTCEEHDRLAASSQFITHTVGRVLGSMGQSRPGCPPIHPSHARLPSTCA